MTDSISRADSARAADGAPDQDRDAKIEQLLLAGLDHYFAGQYQQAINVWTRALFLDRSHARARAYIERARGALAERQRESEELLQSGVQAFERGQGSEARRLLRDALDSGAPSDEALSLLDRLDRIDQASPAASPTVSSGAQARGPDRAPPRPAAPSWRSGAWLKGRRGALGLAMVVVSVAAVLSVVRFGPDTRPAAVASPAPDQEVVLPLPRRAERSLARAQTLAAGGRLRDALIALEDVRATDAEKAEADLLRGRLQRQLLELEGASAADPRGSTP